ncbi:MAG: dihydroorotate dehydrogenase electron transfer subunit [Candidatus Bathyarchaeota archaeon]|nr:MAG: dihydroorotate dehydrogenase electron transfer subunit [Candidatus Bathyarchaeota archaeon]
MSGSQIATNRLRIVKILETKREGPTVKTFTFQDKKCAEADPGQFAMVWIPGVDEVPMSISAMGLDGRCSITVAHVGEATEALHKRKPGDILGVRGPYGNSFRPVDGNAMIVGGGTGIAPLVTLAENLTKHSVKISFVLGAKTHDELLFSERIETVLSKIDARAIITTEDGSYGLKGVATDPAREILEKEKLDMIYTCGPEQMMYKMWVLAERWGTPLQASLERLMRCAIGLCGSCTIGRFMVCKDGPIFSDRQLKEVKDEFGRFVRSRTGKKISLQPP